MPCTHELDESELILNPDGSGLRGRPSGGYDYFRVYPWEPLGVTGVIRGDFRNSTVVAEAEVDVLILPKDVYLRHWHRNYSRTTSVRLAAHSRPNVKLAAHSTAKRAPRQRKSPGPPFAGPGAFSFVD